MIKNLGIQESVRRKKINEESRNTNKYITGPKNRLEGPSLSLFTDEVERPSSSDTVVVNF